MSAVVIQSRMSERWRRCANWVGRKLVTLVALEVLSGEQALDLLRDWSLRNVEIRIGEGEWRPLLVGSDDEASGDAG